MLYTPIVLYSNGEPLDEITLNRALHDIQVNLEQAITNIEDVLNATSEAVPFSLVRRDAAGQSKFGTPTDEQHVIRVAEFRVLDEYVKDLINQTTQNVKRSRLPWASLSDRGIVQLNNSTNSTIQDQAATPYAVKKAYDHASSAMSAANSARAAIPDVIDAVDSNDTDDAGSANAVRLAYENAQSLWDIFINEHDDPSPGQNSGWFNLPGGLIVQYGWIVLESPVEQKSINFPKPFQNRAFIVIGSKGAYFDKESSGMYGFDVKDRFSFVATNLNDTGFGQGHYWLAIGR